MDCDPKTTLSASNTADTGASPQREDSTARWLEANLPLSLDAYEKAALERALVCSWGDAAEAARMLGIGRSTFYRKAGKHGIHLGGTRGEAGRVTAPAPSRESAPVTAPARGDESPSGAAPSAGGAATPRS